ncbi:restriction endonuclease subunit S [Chryseobacterium culicis]|uniref:Type I restriction enzyme, S subunit n=1 Tax=Chryseobacterium culicis TaxID=680127 RepID=A0A1H6HBL7_CHRCI|nr:restriction endonuclease subunit S [Chryseobacterium culicis]SEH31518.1 type I restriction enzyme, S subunit [Chryseobacterium culicis]
MSVLDKLLDGVQVEWKMLGEALVRTTGTNITAGRMKELHKDNAPLKIFAGGKTVAFFNYSDIPEKDINKEPSIIVKSRGVIEFEYYDMPFSHKNEMWSYHSKNNNISIKFIFYYLKINEPYFQNIGNRMQMPQISVPHTDKFQIPIPPLEIQQKIVAILDTFTELTAKLTANLTAELTALKQQYTYYREQLLSFEDGEVECKTLGEVGELVRGNGLPKADFTEAGVPAIHYGQIYTHYDTYTTKTISFVSPKTAEKLKKVNKGDVIITNTSENLDDVGKAVVYLGEETAVTGGHATIFKPGTTIIGKFLAYYTQTEMFAKKKAKYAKGAKVIDVSANDLAKIVFPIPSLKEQARIVSILDKFDTLTTSIRKDLTKENELRKQQYEYYRDLLLTFPKKVN